jgi:hypothetical protein
LILVSIGVITGRELECSYYGNSDYPLWPTFYQCSLSRVNLSESYESQVHFFTGSSWEKSQATAVSFRYSSKIDFIPKAIPEEFPNLNRLIFSDCNLPVLKNDLFPEEFLVLEYLNFRSNQIASIEPLAFQNLKNLKQLELFSNKIQSLPFNLFQNNFKLFYLDFRVNEINSISPNLLKNQNQLKWVNFKYNQCVSREFGCDTCSISQSELDSGLSTCFQNCLKDPDCSTKSELVEGTTEIERERDPIQTTPQVTTTPPPKTEDLPDLSTQNNASANNPNPTLQSLETNLTQELAKNISEKLKSTEENLEKKTATLNQVLQVQQENLANLNQSVASEVAAIKKTVADFRELVRKSEDTCKAETEEVKKIVESQADLIGNHENAISEICERIAENTTQVISSQVEKLKMKMKVLTQELSEAKALMERKDRELDQSKCEDDQLALEIKVDKLEQEINDLKKESQDRENAFDKKVTEIISKKLAEFKNELMNEARA